LFLSERYVTYCNQSYELIKFAREVGQTSLSDCYTSYRAECTCTSNSFAVGHRVECGKGPLDVPVFFSVMTFSLVMYTDNKDPAASIIIWVPLTYLYILSQLHGNTSQKAVVFIVFI
jgi:hypothetical protein